jgi:ABC-2 type transport system permease protein
VLPLTHGLQAIRMLFDVSPLSTVAVQAGLEALVGLGWFALTALTIDRMAEQGRLNGSIEFV